MMRVPLCLLIPLLCAFSGVSLRADEKLDRLIAGIANGEIKAGRAVGMTFGVARGGETLHLKGYGLADIENSVPASRDSVYRIGSITKMFTAAAILLLVEEEKLHLDDALTKFLPDYPADPGDNITIRHLLQHTSGLFSFTDLPDRRDIMRDDMSHEEIVAQFRDRPLHFQPGEKYRYCNSGYYLLGMIIEEASAQKYADFLVDRIFDPLKLDSVVYDRHATIIPHRARGYAAWGGSKFNAPFVSMTQPFAAGALAADAEDLLQWSKALMGNKLLQPDSFEKMLTPGKLNSGKRTRYGFGCQLETLEGHKVVRHGGGIPGFVTELAFFPDAELSVVILSNTTSTRPRQLADRISRSLLPEKSAGQRSAREKAAPPVARP